MSTGLFSISVVTPGTLARASRGIQHGTLRAITCYPTTNFPVTARAWINTFLTTGGTDDASSILSLAQGYLIIGEQVSWHGVYRVEGNELVVATLNSDAALTVNVLINIDLEPL